jgi:hypothetical protein
MTEYWNRVMLAASSVVVAWRTISCATPSESDAGGIGRALGGGASLEHREAIRSQSPREFHRFHQRLVGLGLAEAAVVAGVAGRSVAGVDDDAHRAEEARHLERDQRGGRVGKRGEQEREGERHGLHDTSGRDGSSSGRSATWPQRHMASS